MTNVIYHYLHDGYWCERVLTLETPKGKLKIDELQTILELHHELRVNQPPTKTYFHNEVIVYEENVVPRMFYIKAPYFIGHPINNTYIE